MTSAAALICICGKPMRPQSNFCARCGRELRQICPLCFEERRLLARLEPNASAWCDNRGEVLYACTRCGRWLTADTRQCPDPQCQGRVVSNWPVTNGFSADGTGRAGNWNWPAVWDALNTPHISPQRAHWASGETVHAACLAQGRCYVWAGTGLLSPPELADPLLPGNSTGMETDWRSWLGHDGEPSASLPLRDRMAIVGGGVVLATRQNFLLTGLYPRRMDNQFIALECGVPLAQIAAEGWWVGWGRKQGRPALYLASTPDIWRNLNPQPIFDAPPESAPLPNTPLVLKDGKACWIGEDGNLWQLDCVCRDVKPLPISLPNVRRVWLGNEGVYTVRAAEDGLRVGMDALHPNQTPRERNSGVGPLRDVFASPGLTAVVGERVTLLDAQTGDVLGSEQYSGQWITGLLADAQPHAADPQPRLLMLTQDDDFGNLSALGPISGGMELVWREPGLRPVHLLAAGKHLYIIHEQGVTRLQEVVS